MVLLAELPPEILHNVLIYVDPLDLAWIPRVCRTFYHAVSHNAPLFKHVYLQNLDPPPNGIDLDWERAIKDLVRLQVVCRRTSIADKVCMPPPPPPPLPPILLDWVYARLGLDAKSYHSQGGIMLGLPFGFILFSKFRRSPSCRLYTMR